MSALIRWLAPFAAFLAAACNGGGIPEGGATGSQTPAEVAGPSRAAPPAGPGEALLTRYTWPEPDKGAFAPRDECGKLEGAYEFRLALAEAVLARDTEALLALANEDVKLDFGGGGGKEDLRRRLEGKGFGLWSRLEELLALGCASDQPDYLIVPSFFIRDLDAADPFMAMVVMGADVPLFEQPGKDSPALRSLSWELVELIRSLKPDKPQQLVAAGDGTRGYVETDRLRPLLDYRLLAERTNGKWEVTALVAGD